MSENKHPPPRKTEALKKDWLEQAIENRLKCRYEAVEISLKRPERGGIHIQSEFTRYGIEFYSALTDKIPHGEIHEYNPNGDLCGKFKYSV